LMLGNILFKNNDKGASVVDGAPSDVALTCCSELFNIPKDLLLGGVR